MRPNILIVEDEVAIRMAIEYELRDLGEVLPARGYSEATAQLDKLKTQQKPLNLGVVDLRLGGQDGFHVIKRIQQKSPLTQVIILTVRNDREAWERAKSLPSVRYHITKPWLSKDLVAAAKLCLAGKASGLKLIGTIAGDRDDT